MTTPPDGSSPSPPTEPVRIRPPAYEPLIGWVMLAVGATVGWLGAGGLWSDGGWETASDGELWAGFLWGAILSVLGLVTVLSSHLPGGGLTIHPDGRLTARQLLVARTVDLNRLRYVQRHEDWPATAALVVEDRDGRRVNVLAWSAKYAAATARIVQAGMAAGVPVSPGARFYAHQGDPGSSSRHQIEAYRPPVELPLHAHVYRGVSYPGAILAFVAVWLVTLGVMLVAAGPLATFVERHPTVKMLALSFLILIGVALIAEGLDRHIPRGYIYFAMGFSVFVEVLNIRLRRRREARSAPVELHRRYARSDPSSDHSQP
jgi:hypothetical protein